jgi:hypothetical protein
MWTLDELRKMEGPIGKIDGKWCVARPLNYTKRHLTIKERLMRAWLVFTCKADAFTWPCGQ